jgi:hypothetical protein
MSRKPLPLGTWGKIRTYVTKTDDKGRPVGYRAMAKCRDFDGRTRPVSARGRTKSAAENNLRQSLKERSETGRTGLLTAMHRFSEAAELWMAKFETMVDDGE